MAGQVLEVNEREVRRWGSCGRLSWLIDRGEFKKAVLGVAFVLEMNGREPPSWPTCPMSDEP